MDVLDNAQAFGQLDAINLMLRDLGVADHALAHRAAFRGCTRELVDLRARADRLPQGSPRATAERPKGLNLGLESTGMRRSRPRQSSPWLRDQSSRGLALLCLGG